MEFAFELEASLRDFVSSGSIEVRENGGRLAPLAVLSWEVRGQSEKPLLHIWSEQLNLTRRVIAITDHSEERLALAVERFGRAKPDRLEFVRMDFERSSRELSRDEFCQRLKQVFAEQFPDENVESLTTAPDLEHSLSGNYARGVTRRGSSRTAIVAVPDGESSDTADNTLTFALLWLERLRSTDSRPNILNLRLIVPRSATRSLAHRSAALSIGCNLEIYERDPIRDSCKAINIPRTANLDTWLVPFRESESLLERARPLLKQIVALVPKAITMHAHPQSGEVWLRFRGMPFVRWDQGRVFFGINDSREELTAQTREKLKTLIHDLELHRHPLASDTRHQLYRGQSERWLESIVREDVSRIDASLNSDFVYSQVFATSGSEHGILDLLTVTRSGRLAILELKTSEYIHLPLQAADYFLRIRRHLEQGDLTSYGYFPGVDLQSAPPLIYLVALYVFIPLLKSCCAICSLHSMWCASALRKAGAVACVWSPATKPLSGKLFYLAASRAGKLTASKSGEGSHRHGFYRHHSSFGKYRAYRSHRQPHGF